MIFPINVPLPGSKRIASEDAGIVEAAFSIFNQNMGFNRYILRAMGKLTALIGLIAMAYNLKIFIIL